MADEGHLNPDQFDIVAPHRAVRIAGRNFPAAVTDEFRAKGASEPWMRGALIPAENGALAYVEHTNKGLAVNEPDHQIGGKISSLFYYGHEGHLDAEGAVKHLDEVGRKELSPEMVAKNKETMAWHRKVALEDDDDYPHDPSMRPDHGR